MNNNIDNNMNNDMINYNNKQRRSFDFNLGELKNDTSYHSADSISPHSFDERTFILRKIRDYPFDSGNGDDRFFFSVTTTMDLI